MNTRRVCMIGGCDATVHLLALCRVHYQRAAAAGMREIALSTRQQNLTAEEIIMRLREGRSLR